MQNNQLMRSSIDSLEHTFTSLNITIEKLKIQNQVLGDSLKNLNESITRAGIKTEFYTDQLNFQLFWFSILLALIGFVSWKTFVNPLTRRLNIIENETIPKNDRKINDELSNRMEKFGDDYHKLHSRTTLAISWGLKASRNFYQKEELWAYAILFAMRHIDLYFIDDIIDDEIDNFLIELDSVYKLIEDNKHEINDFSGFEDEILNIINKIKMEESGSEISDLGFKILEIFRSIIKQPETGLEADPHEDPSRSKPPTSK